MESRALTRSERAMLDALRTLPAQPISDMELAQVTGYSVAAITKARRRLTGLGLIVCTPGTGRTPTQYTLPPDA
jgi:predicted transcriptional regulator